MDNIHLCNQIWECACGEGHLSKVLENRGYKVYSTDLIDRGFGDGNIDFLKYDGKKIHCDILTNPPYKYAKEFVKKSFLSVFHNIDLLDLIRKYFKIEIDLEDEIEVEKYFDGSCYIIDKTRHNLLDTDYEAPELENVPIKKVMFNTICFISLENFLNSEHFSFVWGFTNSKFGLLDREGKL